MYIYIYIYIYTLQSCIKEDSKLLPFTIHRLDDKLDDYTSKGHNTHGRITNI